VFVVAGVGLLAAGFLASVGEITPYFTGGFGTAQRFGAVVAGSYQPGESRFSKSLFFADCLDVPRSLFAKAQPPIRRHAFEQRCNEFARVATAQMPTYSEAWLVLSSTAVALDDLDGFRAGFAASQRTGADVHWLSEQRVALAAQHMDQLDDPAKAAYRLDLTSLFDSRGGVEVLATRYLANPGEQQIILEVGETVPASMQQRFLDKVRELKAKQVTQ
jgi:hypothetical protein